ncbi:MAG: hypothetical protein K2G49_06330 [Muribaculum sp.]|nr:hypothetical protein [Muribaculum sp.]
MQCRGEWKLARGDNNPGMCACVRHAGAAGDLPVAPTATRCNPGVYLLM